MEGWETQSLFDSEKSILLCEKICINVQFRNVIHNLSIVSSGQSVCDTGDLVNLVLRELLIGSRFMINFMFLSHFDQGYFLSTLKEILIYVFLLSQFATGQCIYPDQFGICPCRGESDCSPVRTRLSAASALSLAAAVWP